MDDVVFSAHALERYRERMGFAPGAAPERVERSARRLLARATEDGAISARGRLMRLLANGLREARYFATGDVRFVVEEATEGRPVVVTVERDTFGDIGKGRVPRKKRPGSSDGRARHP